MRVGGYDSPIEALASPPVTAVWRGWRHLPTRWPWIKMFTTALERLLTVSATAGTSHRPAQNKGRSWPASRTARTPDQPRAKTHTIPTCTYDYHRRLPQPSNTYPRGELRLSSRSAVSSRIFGFLNVVEPAREGRYRAGSLLRNCGFERGYRSVRTAFSPGFPLQTMMSSSVRSSSERSVGSEVMTRWADRRAQTTT